MSYILIKKELILDNSSGSVDGIITVISAPVQSGPGSSDNKKNGTLASDAVYY